MLVAPGDRLRRTNQISPSNELTTTILKVEPLQFAARREAKCVGTGSAIPTLLLSRSRGGVLLFPSNFTMLFFLM